MVCVCVFLRVSMCVCMRASVCVCVCACAYLICRRKPMHSTMFQALLPHLQPTTFKQTHVVYQVLVSIRCTRASPEKCMDNAQARLQDMLSITACCFLKLHIMPAHAK